MYSVSNVSFCGGETAGSISKLGRFQNGISFRGSGSETAGAISNNDTPKPNPCPTCGDSVNFKGRDTKEKKGMSALGVIGTLAAVSAAAVVGLAYTHKTDVINKMGEGKMKDLLKKIEPATEKCYDWCKIIKDKGLEYWNKFIGMFKSKES